MSKFIEALKEVSQAMSRPIGFGRVVQVSQKPRPLLVAGLNEADVTGAAGHIVGADGLLLPAADSAGQISQSIKIPWGVFARGYDSDKIAELTEKGGDFIVFPAEGMPLRLLEDTVLGRIIAVDETIEDGLIRAVNDIAVDAVFLGIETKEPAYLTWRHLMLCRRLASLLTRPLLVSVPRGISDKEFMAVWEAGAVAVVVSVGKREGPQLMRGLRQRVDKVTFPPQHRIDRGTVVPQVGDRALHEEEAPDEDEE